MLSLEARKIMATISFPRLPFFPSHPGKKWQLRKINVSLGGNGSHFHPNPPLSYENNLYKILPLSKIPD
jgi:hypothetical protein